ncbi:hypothetical protein FXO37_07236 [Capsicum annuum]|nr:hypothetical protein FXO37_07236 [Capsicum annuum]
MSANPSSLSFTFQAILEQAMRDEQEADVPSKLFELFCFAKEGKIPLSINAATLLIRCFGRAKMLEEAVSMVDEALQVFDQMGGSETGGVLVKPFFLPYQLKGKRK